MEAAVGGTPVAPTVLPAKWSPQIHGNREYWPPIHVPHPPYASPIEQAVDEALVAKYRDSISDEPVSHLVDTSQQFPSEKHPEGTYWFPPHPEPDRSKLYQYVHATFRTDVAFNDANVILVLTDTRDIKGQEHWPHTSRLIIERCRMISTHGERWTPIFTPCVTTLDLT